MASKRAVRFGENTLATRKIREPFICEAIGGSEKPSLIRAAYPNDFGAITAEKVWG